MLKSPTIPRNAITTDAAAKMLGVSSVRVRKLIEAGRIRAVKVADRVYLMDPADIAGFERLPQGWPKGKKRKIR